MYSVIRNKNSVRVVNSDTFLTKHVIEPAGKVIRTPLIQGNSLTCQTQSGNTVQTKIYNLKTGQLQAIL